MDLVRHLELEMTRIRMTAPAHVVAPRGVEVGYCGVEVGFVEMHHRGVEVGRCARLRGSCPAL